MSTGGVLESHISLSNEFKLTLETFQEINYIGFLQMVPNYSRIILVILLVLITIGGLKYRWIIIRYLLSPKSNHKVINRLIWIEQILGLFAIFNTIVWILIFLNQRPLSLVMGNWICIGFRYSANFRQSGLVTWSCLISVYRVACLRAQWLLRCGDQVVWAVLLTFGSIVNVSGTIVLSEFVEGSVKSCQFSNPLQDEIFLEYQKLQFNQDFKTLHGESIYKMTLIVGLAFTLVELICYVLFYQFLATHNANIAARIIEPSELRHRKRRNAFSMAGQFAGWFMNVWQILVLGILALLIDSKTAREIIPLFKILEFFLLPVIQAYTSPPIRRFINEDD